MTAADNLLLTKWRLVKLTGWTLDYIDSLSLGRLYECVQIEDGINKARG